MDSRLRATYHSMTPYLLGGACAIWRL